MNTLSNSISKVIGGVIFLFIVTIIAVAPGMSFATTYHNVTFTGNPGNDFASDETVSTSSSGVTAYLTWDADSLYVAYAASNGEPIVIYLDTDPQLTPSDGTGTTGGFNYDGVTPSLPFTANFVAYLKSGYNEYRTWTGSAWSGNTSNTLPGNFSVSTVSEVAIPWSAMGGKPAQIYFLMYKDNGGNYIYGQAPTQVSDGNNSSPTFSYYYSGNVTTGISPFNSPDVPLPVEMSSYSATYTADGVTLNWQTQTELNNLGFNVYRKVSSDADFALIASYKTDPALAGLGTSTTGKSYSFVDKKTVAGAVYDYRIESVNANGTTKDFGPIRVSATSPVPGAYALAQNYPNPFNPTTTISVDVKKTGYARLEIFNSLGEKVATLLNGTVQAGSQHFVWDASKLPSGIYFYRFTTDGFSAMKKMLMVK